MSSYSNIPESTINTIENYVRHGLEPGSFITAVLENNLVEAIGRADSYNLVVIRDIVRYVYNEIPSESWGSRDAVVNWLFKVRKEKKNRFTYRDLRGLIDDLSDDQLDMPVTVYLKEYDDFYVVNSNTPVGIAEDECPYLFVK